jgi:cyclopropane-fatty-acyl-phospholipid synthase
MFEHVGSRNYDEYFAKTKRSARRRRDHADPHDRPPGPAERRRPWSRQVHLPRPPPARAERDGHSNGADVLGSADVEMLRYHYAHTLAEWYRR